MEDMSSSSLIRGSLFLHIEHLFLVLQFESRSALSHRLCTKCPHGYTVADEPFIWLRQIGQSLSMLHFLQNTMRFFLCAASNGSKGIGFRLRFGIRATSLTLYSQKN